MHSLDGYDEISLTGESIVIDEKGTQLLNPQEFKSNKITKHDLYGGNTKEVAADLFIKILKGQGSLAQNEVVITNAAIALQNTHKYGDFEECRNLAKESLESGSALNCLNQLISA